MKLVELDNGLARATLIPARGGLLTSLSLTGPDEKPHEIIWLPPDFKLSESGWPAGGLPLLFPFAGRVFDEGRALHYRLGESIYTMPLHGFAYALPWELIAGTPNRATLRLTNSEKTHELFPFAFELTATYELSPHALKIDVVLSHLGPMGPEVTPHGAMPVAMGIHPYFRMPLSGDGDLSQTHLEVDATEMLQVTPAGTAGKAQPLKEGPLALTSELYHNLILGGFRRPQARLIDKDADLAVRIDWHAVEPIRYAVLWCKTGEGFYCFEPWMGLPNAVSTGAGCHWLDKGQQLSMQFEIACESL